MIENMSGAAFILLYGFPFAGAVVAFFVPLAVVWKLNRQRSIQSWRGTLAFLLSILLYPVGMIVGLLVALQVNRWFFDYRVLAEAVGPDSPAVLIGCLATMQAAVFFVPAGLLVYVLVVGPGIPNLFKRAKAS